MTAAKGFFRFSVSNHALQLFPIGRFSHPLLNFYPFALLEGIGVAVCDFGGSDVDFAAVDFDVAEVGEGIALYDLSVEAVNGEAVGRDFEIRSLQI